MSNSVREQWIPQTRDLFVGPAGDMWLCNTLAMTQAFASCQIKTEAETSKDRPGTIQPWLLFWMSSQALFFTHMVSAWAFSKFCPRLQRVVSTLQIASGSVDL